MPKAADPLAASLDALLEDDKSGPCLLIEKRFGDRPEALAAIRLARQRGRSFRQIATTIAAVDGRSISEGAVHNWLLTQGIE